MTALRTDNANFFTTTLTAAVSSTSTEFPLGALGTLESPAYFIIDPESDSKREVILADGTWTASSVTITDLSQRGLTGSAAGAQDHAVGTLVMSGPLAQHFVDMHDRIDLLGTDLLRLTTYLDDAPAVYVSETEPEGEHATGDLWVDTGA